MATMTREVFIDVEPGIRIRFRRSEAPPPVSYAITLEFQSEGRWTTVRLWDNADSLEEHHEHPYTRSGGKQAPLISRFGTTNDAMAAAIHKAKTTGVELVRQWQQS